MSSAKSIWWSGWICQFTLTLIGFNWVAHTVHEFGHLPKPLSYLALLAFCSFASLHIPIAGVVWHFIKTRLKLSNFTALMLLPALTWLFESTYPMIFDWHFGYTWLWAGFPAFHLAEWIGFKGLSLITIFANILFYQLVFLKDRRRWLAAGAFIGGFAVLNLIGLGLKNRLPAFDQNARVLIVQANIGNLEKQYAEKGLGFRDSILERYMDLTRQGLEENGPVDFALWPETAFPDEMNRRGFISKYVLQLRSFLDRNDLHLATGSYGQTPDTRQTTNSLFFLQPRRLGRPEPLPYHKTVLLAFGEYIPGSVWFPVLKKWLPQVADFARGDGPGVKLYNNLKLGAQICYEGLFDWFTRELAQMEAQIIVNVTNDSWYGTWQEPFQHLYMTLARAIEVRRPLIRSTNTGISTVVLANGEILARSPLHEPWQKTYAVPYWSQGPTTLFVSWGYWLPYLFVFFWALAWIIKEIRDRVA